MQDYDSHITQLTGTVEAIIFRNEKNGYTVCEMHDSGDEFIAVGLLPYIQEGESWNCMAVLSYIPIMDSSFKLTNTSGNPSRHRLPSRDTCLRVF